MTSVFHGLLDEEIARIKALGSPVSCVAGERIFSEGDEAKSLYFVVSGKVSVFIEKFNTKDRIRLAGPGDWFGEMAMFDANRRSASADTLEDTHFLSIDQAEFTGLLDAEPRMRDKLLDLVARRHQELVLKEKMINAEGLRGLDMHIGIKGDPSLRESAMLRERYESIVDKLMPQLVPRLEDLLLNRCAYRLMIGFNSGEIRIATVLDPFSEEYHPAIRLLDDSYVERHFPKIAYADKAAIIRDVYGRIAETPLFAGLRHHLQQGCSRYFSNWEPLSPSEISRMLAQLPVLRSIPSFYIRTLTVGILKDAIHMQFNCDGTHIVSSSGYERFIAENL